VRLTERKAARFTTRFTPPARFFHSRAAGLCKNACEGKDSACRLSLRHYGKRKIVAIATFVTRLQMIAVDSYDRAIGEIGKGPGDRCGCSVADEDESDSYGEPVSQCRFA
jgi:hypothetical protein